MKKTIEEQDELRCKIQPFIDALYKEYRDHGSCHYEFGCIVESIILWRAFHKLLLSQHKQDMEAVKEAIPEKLTDPTATWGEVGNAGWNACRQEVLTKIGGI